MLTEDGGASGDVAIPPTIHALLAARLDRLEPEERAVIERAAVIGKEFWRGAITELTPVEERESAGPRLMMLTRKEFIEPATSIFPDEDGFRFRHILIRDAAYLGVPKETRADLHERYAAWLERTTGQQRERDRRDPRLPPRAGFPVPGGARARQRQGDGAGGQRGRAPRPGRPPRNGRRRRRGRRREPDVTCGRVASRRAAASPGAPDRARERSDDDRRLRGRGRGDRGGGRFCSGGRGRTESSRVR